MDQKFLDAARLIVRDFVNVKPTETGAVVSDRARRAEAEAIAIAATEVGAATIGIDMSQAVDRLLRGEEFWVSPPQHLVAALQRSNVSILTVDETYAFRLDHRIEELFTTGPDCSIYKVDSGMGSWRISDESRELVRTIGEAITSAFAHADQVRVTTGRGTALSLSVRGRPCAVVHQVPERGAPYGLSVPLWGEYNWAPIEDSSAGTIVIDGLSEASRTMREVEAPVTIKVEGGRAVSVEGGRDAEDFRRIFAIDDGAAVLCELGIGGNPDAIPGTDTEKALLGTAHVGWGDNSSYPGGVNRSAAHIDGVTRDVSIEVDGQPVLKDWRRVVHSGFADAHGLA